MLIFLFSSFVCLCFSLSAQVFGGIMIDYSYVECTSASVQALVAFSQQRHFPSHRSAEVKKAISRGVSFILEKQRPDGSWYGSWAVCFTYGAWFGIEGLISAGQSPSSFAVQKACSFLLSKQNADGGWGESYRACVTKEFVQKGESQVVNTAWAALALMRAEAHLADPEPLRKAIKFLIGRQLPSGDWEQEGISGVFNGNCQTTDVHNPWRCCPPALRRSLSARSAPARCSCSLSFLLLCFSFCVRHDHLHQLPQHLPAVGVGTMAASQQAVSRGDFRLRCCCGHRHSSSSTTRAQLWLRFSSVFSHSTSFYSFFFRHADLAFGRGLRAQTNP
jgi:hypothetical protein